MNGDNAFILKFNVACKVQPLIGLLAMARGGLSTESLRLPPCNSAFLHFKDFASGFFCGVSLEQPKFYPVSTFQNRNSLLQSYSHVPKINSNERSKKDK
jgi:hypothetical protein